MPGERGEAGAPAGADTRREKYRTDKLFKRLRRHAGRAIADFSLIKPGDRVMVAMSGGKDSFALLELLRSLQRAAPVAFTLLPVHIDAGFPGAPTAQLEAYLRATGLDYEIVPVPIYRLCREKLRPGERFCPLCARLRRGYLYRTARRLGADKLALGHHKDDVVCTFLLNLCYEGCLKALPPALRADEDDVTVIRPLYYCREADLAALVRARGCPVFPRRLCGMDESGRRAAMMRIMRAWRETAPKRVDIMFRALTNAVPSHLGDPRWCDFAHPQPTRGRRAPDAGPTDGV